MMSSSSLLINFKFKLTRANGHRNVSLNFPLNFRSSPQPFVDLNVCFDI